MIKNQENFGWFNAYSIISFSAFTARSPSAAGWIGKCKIELSDVLFKPIICQYFIEFCDWRTALELNNSTMENFNVVAKDEQNVK